MKNLLLLIAVFCFPGLLFAQAPPEIRKSGPETREPAPNKTNAQAYFEDDVKSIEANCLTHLTTREAWEKERPERRRQFMEMMGLWPAPAKGDLKATVTGSVEGDGFVVEKLHFQSIPGLYVTANLYRPKTVEGKLPTILYVCGHGTVVENGIAYGSKVFYQYHPAWFAKHGYVCLILDTLQLGEIPGEHHGTYRKNMWWWQARGYTPGGVELWNAIRALDYLETRPEVDARRIGVTGRSGGGATSWWVLAADDRPIAFAPVAGIADLRAHLLEGGVGERLKNGVIAGHCDCMFMVNKYRWDFADVAALAAPRPLLLGNSDMDEIFPFASYHRIADKVAKVYKLYGEEAKFQLLETKGPHKDTPELRVGIDRWMNKWLKGDTTTPVEDDLPEKLKPQQLKVFDKLPADAINSRVEEVFVPKAATPEPTKDWRKTHQGALMKALKEDVFAGWPAKPEPSLFREPLGAISGYRSGIMSRSISPDRPVELQIRRHWNTEVKIIETRFLIVKEFADPEAFRKKAAAGTQVFEFKPPNALGDEWGKPGSPDDVHMRRRFPLVGQTLAGMQVWSAIECSEYFLSNSGQGMPIKLEAAKDLAGIAIYTALFEPKITELILTDPPKTHAEGPIFLNVLKHLEIQQAVAMLAPRKVTIRLTNEEDMKAWDWCLKLQEAEGSQFLKVERIGGK